MCERARFVWFANFAENMTGRMDSLFLFPGEPSRQVLALALHLVQATWGLGPGEGRENVDRSASSRSGPTNGDEVGAACAHGTKSGSSPTCVERLLGLSTSFSALLLMQDQAEDATPDVCPGGRATQGPLSGRVTGPNGGTDV